MEKPNLREKKKIASFIIKLCTLPDVLTPLYHVEGPVGVNSQSLNAHSINVACRIQGLEASHRRTYLVNCLVESILRVSLLPSETKSKRMKESWRYRTLTIPRR